MVAQKKDWLYAALQMLRKPAGDDARFSTFASIAKNRDDFIKKTHESYKKLHEIAIGAIIDFDSRIKKAKDNKFSKDTTEDLYFNRLIWRRFNDSLAWLILHFQRHILKRLCFYKERGFLIYQNPISIFKTLTEINGDPYSLAILNDATTCIDIGDILHTNLKTGKIESIELKEGKVNSTLIDSLDCDRALYFFIQKYGEKGKEQLSRFIKQEKRRLNAAKVIRDDKGIDHVTGESIFLVEPKTQDAIYDQELSEIIKNARKEGEAIGLIDGCLWIYVISNKSLSNDEIIKNFSHAVFKQDSKIKDWLVENVDKNYLYPVDSIMSGFHYPVSVPLFLRNIADEYIVDLIFGDLRILFFLNWIKFADLIKNAGGEFSWSSKKRGRQEKSKAEDKRCLVIGERIPIISKGEVKTFMGCPTMVRILFDSIRPSIIAAQEVEMAESFPKIKDTA
jgi:hypothetical protein